MTYYYLITNLKTLETVRMETFSDAEGFAITLERSGVKVRIERVLAT